MLVNPVEEDWWNFLTLDTTSGLITPRFLPTGVEDERGIETLNVFKALTFESVIEGRHRTIAQLKNAAQAAVSEGDLRTTRERLLAAVRLDDYGVTAWFTLGPGATEEPFASLRAHRQLWRRFVRLSVAQQYGLS
jgi:hypothetical protein